MTHHPRTGFGPEITEDELAAAGRAELVRLFAWQVSCSRNLNKDPWAASEWLRDRTTLDAATRKAILKEVFPNLTGEPQRPPRCVERLEPDRLQYWINRLRHLNALEDVKEADRCLHHVTPALRGSILAALFPMQVDVVSVNLI